MHFVRLVDFRIGNGDKGILFVFERMRSIFISRHINIHLREGSVFGLLVRTVAVSAAHGVSNGHVFLGSGIFGTDESSFIPRMHFFEIILEFVHVRPVIDFSRFVELEIEGDSKPRTDRVKRVYADRIQEERSVAQSLILKAL